MTPTCTLHSVLSSFTFVASPQSICRTVYYRAKIHTAYYQTWNHYNYDGYTTYLNSLYAYPLTKKAKTFSKKKLPHMND